MIPTLARSGEMIPGQFGPISRVARLARYSFTRIMSMVGIPSLMQTQRNIGMRTLNDSLFELVKSKQVEPKEAFIKAVDKSSLLALYERGGIRFDPNRM